MGALIAPVVKFVASITVKKALIGLAVYAGINYTVKAAMKKAAGDNLGGLTISQKDPAAPRKILYGESRVGGTIVYSKTEGDDNEYLYQVYVLGDSFRVSQMTGTVGQAPALDAIYAIYFDNELVLNYMNGAWQYWNGYTTEDVNFNYWDGTQTGTPTSLLLEYNQPFDAQHRFVGIGGIAVKLKYDQEKFPNGLPNITFHTTGRSVYDPRKDSTSDAYDSDLGVSTHRATNPATWEYSNNPALCLLDYMRDKFYGIEFNIDRYDVETIGLASTVCEQQILLSNGLYHDRYTLDGVVNTANSINDNIEDMLTAMAGRVYYSEGKYRFYSSSYRTPLPSPYDITEDMIVGDVELLTAASKKDMYNRVQGKFRDENNKYVITSYPTQTNPAYVNADNGEVLTLDLDLPFTTDHRRAQRIAKYTLGRSRNMRTISMRLNMKGYQYCVGDIVNVHFSKFSYTPKAFEIQNIQIQLDPDAGMVVDIVALEDSPTAFDWDAANDELAEQSILAIARYDGRTVTAPIAVNASFIVVSDVQLNTSPKLSIIIDDNPNPFITHYQLYVYRIPAPNAPGHREYLSSSQEFTLTRDFGLRKKHTIDVVDRRVGHYRVTVQAVNISGVYSDVTSAEFEITQSHRDQMLVTPEDSVILVQQTGDLDDEPNLADVEEAKGSPVAPNDEIIYQQVQNGVVVDSKVFNYQSTIKVLNVMESFARSTTNYLPNSDRIFVDVWVSVTAPQGGTWSSQILAGNPMYNSVTFLNKGTISIYDTSSEVQSLYNDVVEQEIAGQTYQTEVYRGNDFLENVQPMSTAQYFKAPVQKALFRFELNSQYVNDTNNSWSIGSYYKIKYTVNTNVYETTKVRVLMGVDNRPN